MNPAWMSWINRDEQYGRHVIADLIGRIPDLNAACDLGAGWGFDLDAVRARFPQAVLHGVDCDRSKEGYYAARHITLHTVDLERDPLPFADESLDLIIANQVLEHLKELFWVCHHMARTVRVGGHLILGVPNICALHNRILFLAGRQPSQMKADSAHVRGFAPRELPRFLESCFPGGFTVARIAAAQFYPFPARMARFLCTVTPCLGHSLFYLLRKNRTYHDQFLDFPARLGLETNFRTR